MGAGVVYAAIAGKTRQSRRPIRAYDASAVNFQPVKIQKRINAVATLRPERGNLVAKYDGSMAGTPKSLRRQFGKKYDGKKNVTTAPVLYFCALVLPRATLQT